MKIKKTDINRLISAMMSKCCVLGKKKITQLRIIPKAFIKVVQTFTVKEKANR